MKDNKTIFYVCPTCNSKFNYVPSECHFCGQIRKTNADRIRSMSDVELAEFLEKVELGEFWADIPWLEWLQQGVES